MDQSRIKFNVTKPELDLLWPELLKSEGIVRRMVRGNIDPARLFSPENIKETVDRLVKSGRVRPEAAPGLRAMAVYAEDMILKRDTSESRKFLKKFVDEQRFAGGVAPETEEESRALKAARTSQNTRAGVPVRESGLPREVEDILTQSLSSKEGLNLGVRVLRHEARQGSVPKSRGSRYLTNLKSIRERARGAAKQAELQKYAGVQRRESGLTEAQETERARAAAARRLLLRAGMGVINPETGRSLEGKAGQTVGGPAGSRSFTSSGKPVQFTFKDSPGVPRYYTPDVLRTIYQSRSALAIGNPDIDVPAYLQYLNNQAKLGNANAANIRERILNSMFGQRGGFIAGEVKNPKTGKSVGIRSAAEKQKKKARTEAKEMSLPPKGSGARKAIAERAKEAERERRRLAASARGEDPMPRVKSRTGKKFPLTALLEFMFRKKVAKNRGEPGKLIHGPLQAIKDVEFQQLAEQMMRPGGRLRPRWSEERIRRELEARSRIPADAEGANRFGETLEVVMDPRTGKTRLIAVPRPGADSTGEYPMPRGFRLPTGNPARLPQPRPEIRRVDVPQPKIGKAKSKNKVTRITPFMRFMMRRGRA